MAWNFLDVHVERQIPSYRDKVAKLFRAQQKTILQKIEGKKAFGNFVELDIEHEQQAFQDALYSATVVIALSQSDVVKQLFGLDIKLEEPDVRSFIEKNVNKFAKETTEETNKQIARTLHEGIDAGDSIPQLSNRIKEVFTIATDSRAEMIARTEVTRSSTWANEHIYKQSGIKQKEWFVNPGACQYCQPMRGKIVGIDKAFFTKYDIAAGDLGGELPLKYESVLGPPLHPNCRCGLLPVLI